MASVLQPLPKENSEIIESNWSDAFDLCLLERKTEDVKENDVRFESATSNPDFAHFDIKYVWRYVSRPSCRRRVYAAASAPMCSSES